MYPQTSVQKSLWLSQFNLWRLLSTLLIVAGAGALALSLTADLLGIGGLPGFGLKQIKVAFVGLCTLVSGIALSSHQGRRHTAEWLLLGPTALALSIAGTLVEMDVPLDFEFSFGTYGLFAAAVFAMGTVMVWPVGRRHAERWLQVLALGVGDMARFLVLLAQLGLLVLVMRQFYLENPAFYGLVLWLTFFGFAIHFFLPLRYRLPFFVTLSMTAIAGVMGFVNGLWLIGLGVGLIALCHLPVAFGWRVLLVVGAGAGLALLRAGWGIRLEAQPWSAAIWPVLGSMFMFRLMVYLYDLRHQKEPVNWSRTLAYFFLLPNVVFPLFPVVDFRTFQRTYYNDERYRIYQSGLEWMVRGVIHLILYRVVNYYLFVGPEEVTTSPQLVQHLVTNFLLYLRVSGQFHLIVGMLHMFGFNLPETHHLYFLASSFTDFWRRINIYWKDFMLKLFYYPAYFRLRRLGEWSGLVLATLLVFVVTWFLHAYQWFWLRGSVLLAGQDALFWTLLALLVVVNSLYEVRRGRKRSLGMRRWSWRELSTLSLLTGLTFSAICVLWSLWTSASVGDWLAMWAAVSWSWAGVAAAVGVFGVVAGVAAVVYVRDHAQGTRSARATGEQSLAGLPVFSLAAARTTLPLLGLYLVGSSMVYAQTTGKTQEVLRNLMVATLSQRDAKLLQRGYYEELTGINRFNSQLWELYARRPQETELYKLNVYYDTGDFLKKELRPLNQVVFMDKLFSTNRWGMRDKDYTQVPPPDTYRIALLGSSYVMGLGVADDETFESLVETFLNRENGQESYSQLEILNFAVGAYSSPQRLWALQHKVLDFQPATLFFVAHPNDGVEAINHLAERVRVGSPIGYPFLEEIVQRAGIGVETSVEAAERQLKPFEDEIIAWTYQQIIEVCRTHDILPVWILIPTPQPDISLPGIEGLETLARQSGFYVLNLSDVYEGYELERLWLSEWDHHPNARGHQLIADRLYQELQVHKDVILSRSRP
jgi:hypothetical protein